MWIFFGGVFGVIWSTVEVGVRFFVQSVVVGCNLGVVGVLILVVVSGVVGFDRFYSGFGTCWFLWFGQR